MTTHVKVVAILLIVFGVLGVLTAALSGATMGAIATFIGVQDEADAQAVAGFMGLLGLIVTTYLLVTSIPSIIAGWGLLNGRSWARILAIILSVLALISIPIGTVFGVYALWVLFQKDTQAMFEGPKASI